jgi:hypothetical protein
MIGSLLTAVHVYALLKHEGSMPPAPVPVVRLNTHYAPLTSAGTVFNFVVQPGGNIAIRLFKFYNRQTIKADIRVMKEPGQL